MSNINLENVFSEMLETIVESSPFAVIVSEDLYNMVENDALIYVLGHFYISVKDVLAPFCPFYLHDDLPSNTFIITNNSQECDELLLNLNYKQKDKYGSSR